MNVVEKKIDQIIRKTSWKVTKPNKLEIKDKNYKMPDLFNADTLVIGNLDYISKDIERRMERYETDQYYIFNYKDGKYQEVFTGFVADTKVTYYDLPYVSNVEPLSSVLKDYKGSMIPKFGMLLVLDEVNKEKNKKYVYEKK